MAKWKLSPDVGEHELTCSATDSEGNTQPTAPP